MMRPSGTRHSIQKVGDVSKRKRRLRALRDRLAAALATRVSKILSGSYDLGLEVISTSLGVRVAARIGDVKVTRTLWPWLIRKGLDALASELVGAATRGG